MSYRECSECGYAPSKPVNCAHCGNTGTMREVPSPSDDVIRRELEDAKAAFRRAWTRAERLEKCAERVYDALIANLDNMSRHNQDALRPAAMDLLAALADEPAR